MHRAAAAPFPARFAPGLGPWLARRWYYTPRTHRAYSVRQISPGDRRLLAEFTLMLGESAPSRDSEEVQTLTRLLFDRVIGAGRDGAVGFAALENTSGGDRVIGVCAYAPVAQDRATFAMAVANSFREEQVGRTLLATLLRHAKRVGVPRLEGAMAWSNRAMQMLAMSMGFAVEPVPQDRSRRLLVLQLK
jgi:N-acetylglutamate synthase-like GNAT family acetyltransferase